MYYIDVGILTVFYTFVGIGVDQDLEKIGENYEFRFNTNTVEDLEKIEENYEFGFNTNTVDLRGIAAERYGRAELNFVGLRTLIGVVLERDGEPEGGYDEQMGQSVADAGSGSGLIGQYAVSILEDKSVWGTTAPTIIA
ncbi:NAD(P)-binding Rossmann-fold superfamily protein [Striga asiatica]|uniref:NAD(P)-binding Rossmann-fold superfamily protein n=1 Tax=Striga asiatica TaxID=4170 RepID=A0A5A7QUX6_STRAF|nr:NAD(P)-binding Rossmann-fold superfamily protein [Striga asiatica]